jgi:hypothetical protein
VDVASRASASRKRGKLACLFIGVGLFVSVVSFGPPPEAREARREVFGGVGGRAPDCGARGAPSVELAASPAELSARVETLFERGEVGEAIEVARRTREVEACNAYRDDFPAR